MLHQQKTFPASLDRNQEARKCVDARKLLLIRTRAGNALKISTFTFKFMFYFKKDKSAIILYE